MAGKRSTSEIVKLEEEFTVWKKKTPELYDLVICHAPEWPSLTVHWSPSPPRPCIDDSSFCTHGLLLGTNTPDEHIQDFLLVAEAVLPTESDSEGRHGESLSIPRVSFPYPCTFFSWFIFFDWALSSAELWQLLLGFNLNDESAVRTMNWSSTNICLVKFL